MIKHGYAEEVETHDDEGVWRANDECKLTAVITDAGRAAVADADGKKMEEEQNPTVSEVVSAASGPDKPRTKQALLIEMLNRQEGATLAQLAEATAWLPHTTRAALTGLRKKGHAIAAEKQDGMTRYQIAVIG